MSVQWKLRKGWVVFERGTEQCLLHHWAGEAWREGRPWVGGVRICAEQSFWPPRMWIWEVPANLIYLSVGREIQAGLWMTGMALLSVYLVFLSLTRHEALWRQETYFDLPSFPISTYTHDKYLWYSIKICWLNRWINKWMRNKREAGMVGMETKPLYSV